MADLTLLLHTLHRGEPDAASALLAQVYAELRALARAKMAREQPGQTLQPTALRAPPPRQGSSGDFYFADPFARRISHVQVSMKHSLP